MIRMRFLVAATVLFGASLVLAQQPSVNPAPGQNDGVIGLRLVAWSALQKPQPVPQQPQTIPTPDQAQPTAPPSQDQPAPKKDSQQPEPETQQTAANSVTGTITKVSTKYVLQTSDNVTYQLDDQDRVKQYEGKRVRVTGTLDREKGMIRVRSIETLS